MRLYDWRVDNHGNNRFVILEMLIMKLKEAMINIIFIIMLFIFCWLLQFYCGVRDIQLNY